MKLVVMHGAHAWHGVIRRAGDVFELPDDEARYLLHHAPEVYTQVQVNAAAAEPIGEALPVDADVPQVTAKKAAGSPRVEPYTIGELAKLTASRRRAKNG